LNCDNVFVQVGPYACRPAAVSKIGVQERGGVGWHAVAKLTPGLSHGFFDVTVAVRESPFSRPVRIPIDLTREQRRKPAAPVLSGLEIAGITDGKTYEYNRVRTGTESCVSVWAKNFPEDLERSEITLRLDGADLPAVFFGERDKNGYRQVNAMLPASMSPGEYQLTVSCRGAESAPAKVELCRP